MMADIRPGMFSCGDAESATAQLKRPKEEMAIEYSLYAPLGHYSFFLFTQKVTPKLF